MSGGFFAEDFRFGGGVETRTEIGINVIDANEVVLDEELAFFGGRDRQIGFVLEDFGSAGLFNEDAFHRLWNICGGCHGSKLWDLTGVESESGGR